MRFLMPANGLIGLILLCWGTWHAFFVAPVEEKMGFVQKIFYYHVPSWWVLFLAVAIAAVGSIIYLFKKSLAADRAAHAAVELAVLFGAFGLITGPLWGWKAWGRPWVWDVRLTTALLLELILIAYLVVRAYAGPGARTLAAGIAIFGVVQVPLVYYSVDLWRGNHPERLVAKGNLDADMRTALFLCAFGFLFLFGALYHLRLMIARDEDQLDELHLAADELGLEDA